ncbi:hypothetical protein WHI96_07990 [Pseudonocardia tropica]|uniref:Uncharacterized protein n=1 Tax=Pseudonocardia tropica TaxID=681289 RepID=A0ABV1JS38_9PSEU
MTIRWSQLGWLIPRQRWLLVPFYGFLFVAGLIALGHPSAAVSMSASPLFTWVWAGFYVVGGFTCTVGALFKSLWGEAAGLPLIASASAIYGTAVLLTYSDREDAAYLVVGLLLMSQALGLFDRWLGVMSLLSRVRELGTD